jgi:hypothetical protein
MPSLSPQLVVIIIVCIVVWLKKRGRHHSSLGNLPGPPSSSTWLTGVLINGSALWLLLTYRHLKVTSVISSIPLQPGASIRSSWTNVGAAFVIAVTSISQFCFLDGPAVRLDGKFGENQLYTFDTKALHHILVKVCSMGLIRRDHRIMDHLQEQANFEKNFT